MEYQLISGEFNEHECDCICVGLFNQCQLSPAGHEVDRISEGYLSKVLARGDIEGKANQTLLLQDVPNIKASRVLLVGCGDAEKLSKKTFRQVLQTALRQIKNSGVSTFQNYLTELDIENIDTSWKLQQAILASEDALYSFQQLKSDKSPLPRLANTTFAIPADSRIDELERNIQLTQAIAKGMKYCKELANLPANICTPTYLADEAQNLAKNFNTIKTTVFDEKDIQKRGMNAFLSVAAGSMQPAKFITMEYSGGDKSQQPIVLIGKGVTFDAGGISLKPASKMDEMKYDMCGAATVFGVLLACAEFELPLQVIGLIPATENLPGGKATKPGDIISGASGKSIEILNTDAEGRLILSDALTYAERFEPSAVIDIATLTGAMVVALGNDITGVFCEHTELRERLLTASRSSDDHAWPMPIWENYQELLDSPFADMANIGGPTAGSITAACFLSRFAEKYPWAHLDIAGTAWKSGGQDKAATGRPIPLLMQYLFDVWHEQSTV